MAIMQSCCCWRSVRRGSFACALYTGIYFILLALTTGKVLQGESQYLRGNRSLPESTSFLEPDTISPTTVRFNVTLLVCSCCGLICCILLLYGLCKSAFDPTKVMLYTLNFFLLCLNIYSVLCVISQYQEYMAGRGTAADDYEYGVSILRVSQRKQDRDKRRKVPAVRYAVQPPTTTATSCLSSRRTATNNETKTTATPTQSPTAGQNTLSSEKSPVSGRPSRKHVQFPDTASDSQKGKSEVPLTTSVLKMEAKNEHATPSSSLKLEEATIDQILLSRKNSCNQDT
ncbi:uncharacterized protein LOC122529994 isoform X3 [Frieseomelitta varia]|uniref:uncharacterized protein LOC122529994 isoform X3 n=1 Tax=Frieseomelitta varia TaxID=561572 RepID=UPI001CB68D55|nr:uncharacterized protein LOC122529994 isoform X3 [Frieseomelitta varia]